MMAKQASSRLIEVIWPERKFLTEQEIIEFANEDVSDGAHDGPLAKTFQEAMEILNETGSVTFHSL